MTKTPFFRTLWLALRSMSKENELIQKSQAGASSEPSIAPTVPYSRHNNLKFASNDSDLDVIFRQARSAQRPVSILQDSVIFSLQ